MTRIPAASVTGSTSRRFGNLYLLNAEEEPEQLDYPGQDNPAYKAEYGPRRVMHTWATQTDDPTTLDETR